MKADNYTKIDKAYSEHYNYIYRKCLHLMHFNQHDADDLTSEVFLLFTEQHLLGKIDIPDDKIRSWLISASKNKFNEYIRKQTKFGNIVDIDSLSENLDISSEQELEDLLFERLIKANIDVRIIEQLSEEDKKLLHMIKIQKLEYDEIAQLLGIKVTAARERVSRLKKKIKNITHDVVEKFDNTLVTFFLLILISYILNFQSFII